MVIAMPGHVNSHLKSHLNEPFTEQLKKCMIQTSWTRNGNLVVKHSPAQIITNYLDTLVSICLESGMNVRVMAVSGVGEGNQFPLTHFISAFISRKASVWI